MTAARISEVWTLIEGNCNAAEIAAYYRVPVFVAQCWMLAAKRAAYRDARGEA